VEHVRPGHPPLVPDDGGLRLYTFRLTNEAGQTSLVKFHWKPKLGVHSLTWEEAQLIGGLDPDFHRRDLADAIEAGAYPEWELGVQVFPDNTEQSFEGIDLLDPTKIVPEELAPVQRIGRMTLTANPTNFFAETEQVAFHPGHLVPGIDVTDDPLLQVRLFSYLDTQISRLAGPNFSQIPVNRPHAPVNDMFRDGWHRDGVHAGAAPYRPNSLDGGCPFTATAADGAYVEAPVVVPTAGKVREVSASFADHLSQARMFYRSMSPVEQEHIIRAYTFELGKCYEQAVKERQLLCLANIDETLCREVAAGLGLSAPSPTESVPEVEPSPALSQVGSSWPSDGRVVGIVVDVDGDLAGVDEARTTVFQAGMVPLLVAARGGTLPDGTPIQRTFLTARSVEYDALLLAAAPGPAPDALVTRDAKAGAAGTTTLDPRVVLLLGETWRQAKAIGAWGAGRTALSAVDIPPDAPGVETGDGVADVLGPVLAQMGKHRAWERFAVTVG
jgi:catalase